MTTVNTRKRLFLILRLIYEKTDEEHPMDTNEIIEYVNGQGMSLDRKTLKSDMDFLINELHYDIVKIKSSPNRFFWGERKFELPELRMLIDAVASSHFINDRKSEVLTEKLMSFAGTGDRQNLRSNIYATGKRKSANTCIYYIVDRINEAINMKRKISFRYYEFNTDKEKVYRNDGEVYTMSPYVLYWNEDNYYVVGYSDKRSTIVSFRVERLADPEILDEEAEEKPDDFSIVDYGNKIFGMFSGEDTKVTLRCESDMMKYIIDRFGMDVEPYDKSDRIFRVKAEVQLSPTFYGWVFQFGGKIAIEGPVEAVRGYRKMLRYSMEATAGEEDS